MSENVQWKSLDEIATFASGGTPSKSNPEYWNGQIPWVSAKDMKGPHIVDTEDHISLLGLENGTRLAPAGATLVLVRGMTLLNDIPICISARDLAFNQDIKALVPKEGVLGTYLNYAIRAAKPAFLAAVDLAGHGTGKLPTDIFKSIQIRLPSKGEQSAIAQILGTLDDKIELNRRMNETLEAMARAIFQSWFVDFDPVRAKANGEPTESICKRLGLTPELLALFPDSFEDSARGDVPLGWKVATLSEFCELNAKSWTAKTLPENVHYVDLANTKNGVINDVQVFAKAEAPSRARRMLLPRDTIIGTVRPGNRSFALVGEGEVQLTGSTGFAVLSPLDICFTEFVYLVASSDENIDRLARLADGGAYPAISPEIILATACVKPHRSVIEAFHAAVRSLMQMYEANNSTIGALANTRDSLLPRLLSGEIELPEIAY
jgi:type I restriction enzyme, S subunit